MSRYSPESRPVDDAVAELLAVGGEIRQFKDFLADQVAEMRAQEWRFTDDKGAEQFNALVGAYERALDRTARVLVEITRLNLEERQVRISESIGLQLAAVIRAVLDEMLVRTIEVLGDDAASVALVQARWPVLVGEVVPRQIQAVTSGG